MSVLEEIGFIETEAQERARLARSPKGSTNHLLSTLPVTINDWPIDQLIRLPRFDDVYDLVVVPIEFHKDADESLPRKRYTGYWTCAIVKSNHPSYRVGGYRISVDAAELARGQRVEIS